MAALRAGRNPASGMPPCEIGAPVRRGPDHRTAKSRPLSRAAFLNWLRELDLNQRPSGYEPDELPGCSIPRQILALRNAARRALSLSEEAFALRRSGSDL